MTQLGILFLTTNRVETFDDAFQSRIHVALRYGELTMKAKRAVWQMFIGKVREIAGVEIAVFKESDFDKLAKHTLNGRQVSHFFRNARGDSIADTVLRSRMLSAPLKRWQSMRERNYVWPISTRSSMFSMPLRRI